MADDVPAARPAMRAPKVSAGPRVAILGGGPAGLGAALRLHEQKRGRATLIEQGATFGGNAGSFEWEGQRLDFGSHRLHPTCEPRILADLKRLLGADLLDRPRHGRIALMGRFIQFPLKPLDLLFKLPPGFGFGVARDAVAALVRRRAADEPETFASMLRGSLGPTMSERFYFPYARKLWGLDATEISAMQARRRITATSPAQLLRRVLQALPGMKRPGAGRFLYPRQGYGQISETLASAATNAGALLLPEHHVTLLRRPQRDEPWFVIAEHRGEEFFVEAEHVWSTIPITLLPTLIDPAPPREVLAAAAEVKYRAMLLIYLRLPVAQFTGYDAHYMPQQDVAITRLSEPKNYTDLGAPAGATTLCAELPCDATDPVFGASDETLAEQVAADLARCGMPLPVKPTAIKVVRLAHAYPVYRKGYEQPLGVLEHWLESLPRLVSYGRQGSFAHDNTHHALAMAYAAVDCLSERGFDRSRWAGWHRVFANHVVED